jgi:hypothetical protein
MSKAFEITPDNPAIHTLVRLHADLGGRIQQNKDEAKRLADEMRHVEAVIKLLNPDYDTRRIAVRRRVQANPWFERGDQYRAALDALRKATAPLTAREIVLAMLAAKGVTDATPKQIRDLVCGVQSSLANHVGKTVERLGEGMPKRWRVNKL